MTSSRPISGSATPILAREAAPTTSAPAAQVRARPEPRGPEPDVEAQRTQGGGAPSPPRTQGGGAPSPPRTTGGAAPASVRATNAPASVLGVRAASRGF